MFHEYAVDPGCFGGYDRFLYLVEGFGFSQGRLVAGFPRDWPRRVDQSCRGFSFKQRQVMADELTRIRKSGLIRSGRPYDGDLSWKENAVTQHNTKAFHAIITTENEEELDCVLEAAKITKRTNLWKAPKDKRVLRSPEQLGTAVRFLLQNSQRIVFVDRNFRPALRRWRSALTRFIEIACEGRSTIPDFEYHVRIQDDDLLVDEEERKRGFLELCQRHLVRCLPPGVALKIFRWRDDKTGEDEMHERCIVTEKGAVGIDFGLDEGWKGRTKVSLLDVDYWEETAKIYREDSAVFELIDVTAVIGTD